MMKGRIIFILFFCLLSIGCVERIYVPVGTLRHDETHLLILVENPSPYEVTVYGAIKGTYPPHSSNYAYMPCEGYYHIVEEVQKIITWDDNRIIERYYLGERSWTFRVSPRSYDYGGESLAARVTLGQGYARDPNNVFNRKEIPLLTPPPCGIIRKFIPSLRLEHTPGVQMHPTR